MGNIVFINFNSDHKDQLNTWQQKEQEKGFSGLDDFVVPKGSLLGDFLTYIVENVDDIMVHIAVDANKIVGFICTTCPTSEHFHIEIMGVNPDLRGKGYAKRLLEEFKKQATYKFGLQRLTLNVKENNESGKRAFAKIGKLAQDQPETNYIAFEL